MYSSIDVQKRRLQREQKGVDSSLKNQRFHREYDTNRRTDKQHHINPKRDPKPSIRRTSALIRTREHLFRQPCDALLRRAFSRRFGERHRVKRHGGKGRGRRGRENAGERETRTALADQRGDEREGEGGENGEKSRQNSHVGIRRRPAASERVDEHILARLVPRRVTHELGHRLWRLEEGPSRGN